MTFYLIESEEELNLHLSYNKDMTNALILLAAMDNLTRESSIRTIVHHQSHATVYSAKVPHKALAGVYTYKGEEPRCNVIPLSLASSGTSLNGSMYDTIILYAPLGVNRDQYQQLKSRISD